LQTGTKISGFAHIGLIGWMVVGGVFTSDPDPFVAREVSVISSQDFEALLAAQLPPATASQPAALPVPDIPVENPDVQTEPDVEPEQVQPSETTEPATDSLPDVVPSQPAPQLEVTDVAPVLQPPAPEISDINPTDSPTPVVRPVDRVAPTLMAPAPPDVAPDDVTNPEVAPKDGADTPQETQQATAPEEASDRIVTEVDEVASLAPVRSIRPPARPPARPAAQPTAAQPTAAPTPDPKPATNPAPKPSTDPTRNDSIADALSEALGGTQTPAPTGPPLSQGEKDALRVSVSRCWNVGSLSTAALAVTVVVEVSMTSEGKPEASSIRMLSSSGGDGGAAKQAFDAARRAIIRCGASGFDLPSDKYAHWRVIEMTFNPERMRIK
jgi:hypothetical protein